MIVALPARPWRVRPRTESALIRAVQAGEEAALGELFRRHWSAAHRAAWLITHDAQAAEDVAQEAFLAALRRIDRFDRHRPFAPWLHRIVVNRAIDWSRARTSRREDMGAGDGTGSQAAASDPGRIDDELLRALAELTPEHRAVVVLRHLLGFTPGEIARALDLPRGTVNSRLRRALNTLAERLE